MGVGLDQAGHQGATLPIDMQRTGPSYRFICARDTCDAIADDQYRAVEWLRTATIEYTNVAE